MTQLQISVTGLYKQCQDCLQPASSRPGIPITISTSNDGQVWLTPHEIGCTSAVAAPECPSYQACGRQDRCGLFSFPARCSPGGCSQSRSAQIAQS